MWRLHPSGTWVGMTPRLGSVGNVDWSTSTRPLCVAWTSSQHGACVPRGNVLRSSTWRTSILREPGRSCVVSFDTASAFMQDYFCYIPLVISKSQRPAQMQGERLLDRGVASSHCRRAQDRRYCCNHLWKKQSATTLLMVIFALCFLITQQNPSFRP